MENISQQAQCLTCKSLRGEISLAPGPVIYEGIYWRIEHVAPTAVRGWLVILLKRHAAALHELSTKEFSELATLSEATTKILFEKFNTEKEYMMCFAEGEGFKHIHIHIVPKQEDLLPENKGPNIFRLLGPKVENPLSDETIQETCSELKILFENELKKRGS